MTSPVLNGLSQAAYNISIALKDELAKGASNISATVFDTLNKPNISSAVLDSLKKANISATVLDELRKANISAAIWDDLKKANISATVLDVLNKAAPIQGGLAKAASNISAAVQNG